MWIITIICQCSEIILPLKTDDIPISVHCTFQYFKQTKMMISIIPVKSQHGHFEHISITDVLVQLYNGL